MTDTIHKPAHYAKMKIEPVVFIMENELDYPTGNVIKYVVRWKDKGGLEDLYKARSYIDRMIAKAEGKEYGRGVDTGSKVPRPPKKPAVRRKLVPFSEHAGVRAGSPEAIRIWGHRDKARR